MYNLWDEAKRDMRKGNDSSEPSAFKTDCGSSIHDYDCEYSYDYDSEDEGRECENPYTFNVDKRETAKLQENLGMEGSIIWNLHPEMREEKGGRKGCGKPPLQREQYQLQPHQAPDQHMVSPQP